MQSRRKFDRKIKTLLHFDYPYFREENEGLRDEINGNIYNLTPEPNHMVNFAGTELPCYPVDEGTPRFGYRCLDTTRTIDYIYTAKPELIKYESEKGYVIECFIRIRASTAGNIMRLAKSHDTGNVSDDVIALKKTADNTITLTSEELILNIKTTEPLNLSEWYHVRAKLSGGTASININGEERASGSYKPKDLTGYELRIGGMNGQIDEFMISEDTSLSGVPSEPYQGVLDLESIGGYGEGNAVVTVEKSSCRFNSYGAVKSVSGARITLTDITKGDYSEFTPGTEIMLHVTTKKKTAESELGRYAFRKIIAVSGNVLTLNSTVTEEFNLSSCVSNYNVQAISVPHFKSLTVKYPMMVTTKSYTLGKSGGIIACRVKEDALIEGYILPSSSGLSRTDNIQMTHSELIDRFLIGSGGGVFITCGGRLTTTSTAKIGNSSRGTNKGGSFDGKHTPEHAGAGYGGFGGSVNAKGNAGRVGIGGSSDKGKSGGRPGHDGPSESETTIAKGGACAIIAAKRLSLDADSICTGGYSVTETEIDAGGGGTGFAYIAGELEV